MTLPDDFTATMAPLLGAEYEDFLHALETQPILRGLRVNTRKISAADFAGCAPVCPDSFASVP